MFENSPVSSPEDKSYIINRVLLKKNDYFYFILLFFFLLLLPTMIRIERINIAQRLTFYDKYCLFQGGILKLNSLASRTVTPGQA